MAELSPAVMDDVAAAAPAEDAIVHEPAGAPAPVAGPCKVRVVDDLIGVLIDDDAPWAIADYEILQGEKNTSSWTSRTANSSGLCSAA